jgi:hypothetical protein
MSEHLRARAHHTAAAAAAAAAAARVREQRDVWAATRQPQKQQRASGCELRLVSQRLTTARFESADNTVGRLC